MMEELTIIGGGLAGSEAAWQAARRGVRVVLFEMRPAKLTEAHKTGLLGELVCSNSLRSDDPSSAPGLLKRELQEAGSLIMKAAEEARVPAGTAFAVDREIFAAHITSALMSNPMVRIVREEVKDLPRGYVVLATGPLTSKPLADALGRRVGQEHLSFYDAIAPIISADSIDEEKVFFASRYGKGGDDYINCPMSREQYDAFYQAIIEADKVNIRDFEDARVFEGCMPLEVMAIRGRDTMRFGPLKPVGLPDPRTGKEAYAVVQLRPENRERTSYNMVGCQTRLKWPEQKRVFSLIPGLERAEFLRYGSVHRNTFVNAPLMLDSDLSLKAEPNLFLAGQITGVEGYIESTAMGLISGLTAAGKISGRRPPPVPETTAHGALIRHLTTPVKDFQPSNINFGLVPPLNGAHARVKDKKMKKKLIAERALNDWKAFLEARE